MLDAFLYPAWTGWWEVLGAKLNKLRLDFMDFVLDLPQVSCGEGFQLTFDQMLGTDFSDPMWHMILVDFMAVLCSEHDLEKFVLVITCHWLNVRISKKRCLSHDSMAGTSYLEVIKRVICWSCEHGRSSKWVHRCRLAYNFWMMHSNAFVVVKDNLLTFQSGRTITFNRFNRLESVQRTKVNVGRSLWQLLLIHRPPAICCREPFNFFHRPAPHIC